MTLRGKMVGGASLVMVLVGALLTANLVADGVARREAQLNDKAEFLARLAGDWVRDEPGMATTDWAYLHQRFSTSPLVSGFLVVGRTRDADGGTSLHVATSSGERDLTVAEERHFAEALDRRRIHVEGSRAYAPMATGRGEYAIRVDLRAAEATGGFDLTSSLANIVVIMFLGTLILVLLTYMLLNRLVLKPLAAISEASRRVAEGDYSKRIPVPDRRDEVAEMILAMNSMMEKIEAYHARLKEDIREARERITHTQRILVHAQRLSTTGTLAAGIAHEINNPLGGMMNAVGAIKSGRLDADKQREYLELVGDGLDRIRRIVQQVLHFRPKAFEPRPLDLKEVVDKASAFLDHKAQRKSVRVSNEIPEGLPRVQGDPLELQQAVLNLLMNAVDAVSEGEGRVRVRHEASDVVVRILIEDNGIGMTPEELAHCMDPFFTTKEQGEGTGLGLAVAGSIVENHGGKLLLSSRKGKGTVATIELPATPA